MSKVGASLTRGAGVEAGWESSTSPIPKSSLETATENFVLYKPAF